jgi:hypothetical protein
MIATFLVIAGTTLSPQVRAEFGRVEMKSPAEAGL